MNGEKERQEVFFEPERKTARDEEEDGGSGGRERQDGGRRSGELRQQQMMTTEAALICRPALILPLFSLTHTHTLLRLLISLSQPPLAFSRLVA